MLASQIPTKFPIPFGNNAAAGTIRPVPQASQASVTPGAASLYDGFPTITGQPLASGGIPPSLQDFNGLLNQITAWSRWQNAGGTVSFDPTFCTAIGGYPQGAVLASTTSGILWLSLVDNNTTDPDSGSASGWIQVVTGNVLATRNIVGSTYLQYANAGTYTWTVPTDITRIRLRVWGGGGGGGAGSSSASGGSGGGGGGYGEGVYTVTPSQALTVIVGAGGAAGTASTTAPTSGGAGGTSSVGSLLSVTGGQGGQAGNGGTATQLSNSGTATGAQLGVSGYFGGLSYTLQGVVIGGSGGAAFGTSQPPVNVAPAGGNPGMFPGGGAGGAAGYAAGGAGAIGLVCIEY